jgi:hypothetical protein
MALGCDPGSSAPVLGLVLLQRTERALLLAYEVFNPRIDLVDALLIARFQDLSLFVGERRQLFQKVLDQIFQSLSCLALLPCTRIVAGFPHR